MSWKNRTMAVLLAVCLLAGLLPSAALAAGAAICTTTLDLTEGASETSGDGWSWDLGTGTLTLSGIRIQAASGNGIELPRNATIELAEGTENTVAAADAGEGVNSYGIFYAAGLTITGSGTLRVTGGDAGADSYGIGSDDHSGTELNIIGNAVVEAAGGSGVRSCGIYDYNGISIFKSANVTAEGGAASLGSYGLRGVKGDVLISENAVVRARGGEDEPWYFRIRW